MNEKNDDVTPINDKYEIDGETEKLAKNKKLSPLMCISNHFWGFQTNVKNQNKKNTNRIICASDLNIKVKTYHKTVF